MSTDAMSFIKPEPDLNHTGSFNMLVLSRKERQV
jgi:hypothetical protein